MVQEAYATGLHSCSLCCISTVKTIDEASVAILVGAEVLYVTSTVGTVNSLFTSLNALSWSGLHIHSF